MKRFWFLITLLFSVLFISWCFQVNINVNDTSSVVEEDKPSIDSYSGRLFACNEEVGKYYNITTFWGSWDTEEEAWASFVLNWEVTFEVDWEEVEKKVQCVVDMVDSSVRIIPFSDKSDEEFEVDQSDL